MKAVVVQANRQLVVADIEKPEIKQTQDVLVKVHYSGLCGSDIPRIFHHGTHFYPIVLGHEFSGIVEQVGADVSGLVKGDLVTCAPLQPCFSCDECQKGFYSLCKNYNFIGSRKFGANAEYIVLNQRNLVRIPTQSEALNSAFIEPITVGLHAMYLAQGCQDKNVIVVGAGTIGLLAAQAAKALGAKSVTVIDINQEKLQLATELGADFVFNSMQLTPEEITRQLNEHRFDQLILETAGVPKTVELSIQIAGPRAQIALVGTLHQDLQLDQQVFGFILRKELSILGSWMNYSTPWPGKEWSEAARLIAQNKINIAPLIASINSVDSYVEAVMALDGKPMNGKLMLKFD
ncbi:galactitol-1-phosphate 5-dehydrogenase [Rodentibacter genomosp. 2]|uniref:Galactitol-1-phosphate 5-dehydrogenase n=1 Tax=Rodentibacter genomosp. 2 TaxID=1908266 RepID=A0A1V3JQY4_9PAST|nr:galactitol-1-phosphate 5-dehydrogenase [Rodentibacter genomosp. 2]OOF58801.1 galactitol-1-phosphate 5-dehydrogenase [Rodentibacter genomosp. 2]